MSDYEYKKMLGFKAPKTQKRVNTFILNTAPLADSVDWRQKGAVTPIKDQGGCGSCWAFSAVGAMEGANAITKGQLLSLSEQQLVDCSGAYGNAGCGGGWMDQAFNYAKDTAMDLETEYPYAGINQSCMAKPGHV